MVKDRKYLKAALFAIAAFVVGTGINYWAAYFDPSEVRKAMTVTNKVNSRFEYSSFYTRWALILGIKVTGFELAKSWYLKSRENLEMFRIKAKSETRARKSRISGELDERLGP